MSELIGPLKRGKQDGKHSFALARAIAMSPSHALRWGAIAIVAAVLLAAAPARALLPSGMVLGLDSVNGDGYA